MAKSYDAYQKKRLSGGQISRNDAETRALLRTCADEREGRRTEMGPLPSEAYERIREEFRDAYSGPHPRVPNLANCGITRSLVNGTVQYQYFPRELHRVTTSEQSDLEQREDAAKRRALPWRFHA